MTEGSGPSPWLIKAKRSLTGSQSCLTSPSSNALLGGGRGRQSLRRGNGGHLRPGSGSGSGQMLAAAVSSAGHTGSPLHLGGSLKSRTAESGLLGIGACLHGELGKPGSGVSGERRGSLPGQQEAPVGALEHRQGTEKHTPRGRRTRAGAFCALCCPWKRPAELGASGRGQDSVWTRPQPVRPHLLPPVCPAQP